MIRECVYVKGFPHSEKGNRTAPIFLKFIMQGGVGLVSDSGRAC